MIKTLRIVTTNLAGNPISNSSHMISLFEHAKVKQLNVIQENCESAVTNPVKSDEALLLTYQPNAINLGQCLHLLNQAKGPVFIFPTQLGILDEVEETLFQHPAIAKIIVSSEFYQKYFTKNLNIETSKVKLIYLGGQDYFDPNYRPKPIQTKVIMTPGLLREGKNYKLLLESIKKLALRYRSLKHILFLKPHPDDQTTNHLMVDLVNDISRLKLNDICNIIMNREPYSLYLKLPDLILLPPDETNRMYSGALLDGIMAQKAVVTPSSNYSYDLCKKEAGIFLYQPEDLQSVVDACSIVLENKEIKEILEQQNGIISKNYSMPKIAQQYLNLVRRFKE